MKEKVIFDTNTVRNTETNNFLGGRIELERFLQVADIVIPETVIQEIKRQKRKSLSTNKNKFISNPLHKLVGLNEEDTKAFDVDSFIQQLIDDESIPFEIIDIKNNDVLPQIKELALHKKAPFESGDNTDKGFKDALIYFSVLEYLQEIPNKNVFVCAKDGRLKEAFNQHHNIIVVESYDEFKQKSVSQFFDDYFIEKVNAELDLAITKDNVVAYWHNIDDNQNVLIKVEVDEYIIEVDSGEIVNSANKNEFTEELQNLLNSTNFNKTDLAVAELQEYATLFSQEENINVLNAAFVNAQIRWIIEKEEMKQFFGPIYLSNSHLIDAEKQEFFKEIFE
jgi:rRNA-processing protein FCF1